MQQIERYGIIALLFLVVSIVVVALWDPDPGGTPHQPGVQDGTVAAAEPRSERARPQTAPGTAPARTTSPRTQAPVQVQRRPNAAAPRSGVPSLGAERTPGASYRPSAPLDLGGEAAARQRGRTGRSANRSSRPVARPQAEPVAPVAGGTSALTREPTQPNASARRVERTQPRQEVPQQVAPRREPVRQAPPAGLVAATTQPSPQPQARPAGRRYTVKAGDTLGRIASRELGSSKRWRALAEANGISNPDLVRVGDVLVLPASLAAAPAPQAATPQAAPAPAPAQGSGSTYVVAKGDVLSRIAERELGSAKRWREIVALNPGLNPDRLFVGKRIQLPTGSAPAGREAPVTAPQDTRRVASADAPRRARFQVQ